GMEALVPRVDGVKVRAQDAQGEFFERDLENMNAVCMQHEMDHLAGRLFVDRLPAWRKWYSLGAGALRRQKLRQAANA
ncbi:MAG: peptide deformylase, partial [Pseudomonadota bacterium]